MVLNTSSLLCSQAYEHSPWLVVLNKYANYIPSLIHSMTLFVFVGRQVLGVNTVFLVDRGGDPHF